MLYHERMNKALRGGRVAFFGGSFDPPHVGHLAVARAARAALNLDTVLFAPVGAQPLKPAGSSASFEDRVAMTRLAVAGETGFALSLADAPRHQRAPNYTLETLRTLGAEFAPEVELFCLMGADSFAGLRHWRGAAELPFTASLIVAARPGFDLADLQAALPEGLTVEIAGETASVAGVPVRTCRLQNQAGAKASLYLLPGLHVEVSASAMREAIGGSADRRNAAAGMLPRAVAEYIGAHQLYR